MTAILHSLQDGAAGFTSPIDQYNNWVFSNAIDHKEHSFFAGLTLDHDLLHVEYNLQCAKISDHIAANEKDFNLMAAQAVEALMLAELLIHLYRHYLDMPLEVLRLQADQKSLRSLLTSQGYSFPPSVGKVSSETPYSLTEAIRLNTIRTNWLRLLFLRLRRLALAAIEFLDELTRARQLIISMEEYVATPILYLGWLFFIPRLACNLFLTGKHVIPGKWMQDEEYSLGWALRFRIQLRIRWFEEGNDIGWLIAGLLNCFVFTDAPIPIRLQLAIALQTFDLLMALLRYAMELQRLHLLKADYENRARDPMLAVDKKMDADSSVSYLHKRIDFEHKRLQLGIFNHCGLLISIAMALPVFASVPAISVLGAILAVLSTIVHYSAVNWVEQQRPPEQINKTALESLSIFQPASRTFVSNVRNDVAYVTSEEQYQPPVL